MQQDALGACGHGEGTRGLGGCVANVIECGGIVRLKLLLMAATMLLGQVPIMAQAAYHAGGVGAASSCGTWVAERARRRALGLEQWLMGFLSGVGWSQPDGDDPLTGLDANAVFLWMDNYCSKQPLEPIAMAAARLALAHRR